MTLSQKLREYIAACITGLWVTSHEHPDALREIAQLCRDEKWSMATWDADRGLSVAGQATASAADPVAAIKSINALTSTDGSALLVLPNFHRFMESTEIIQALAHQIQLGKNNRTFVVVLSPVRRVPIELEKLFKHINHELPDRRQLLEIAHGIATEAGEMPQGDDLDRLLDAASGLTRFEAEEAFSLSLRRKRKLVPQTVWELKGEALTQGGFLSLYRGKETFADIGGMVPLKDFAARVTAASRRNAVARARGLMLVSLPGCGKSQLCKALGNQTGRPTLVLDMGALRGRYVGETEERTRQALSIAEACSPCNLFLDEADKALAGIGSDADSGVSSRLFGSLLTFMSDHTSDVFVTMTANDISKLPPEFLRAERFDAVFFIDLPSAEEKEKIWPIHLAGYKLDPKSPRPDDRDWTGAEIRSCCRLASLLGVPLRDAANSIVPVAVTAAESVEKLRNWAAGRCLDASRGGIYTRAAPEPVMSGRRVSRPGNN